MFKIKPASDQTTRKPHLSEPYNSCTLRIKFAILNRHSLLYLVDESSMKNQLRIGTKTTVQKSAISHRKIHFEIEMHFPFRKTNETRTMTLFYFSCKTGQKKSRRKKEKGKKRRKEKYGFIRNNSSKYDNKYKIII